MDDLTIRNNITYAKPDKFALGVVGLPANNVKVGYNIIFNENGPENVTNKMSATCITNLQLFSGGWLESNPLLIDPSGFDFHLMVASPAVNYGSNLTSATLDIDGNNRDSHPDAGAYEYNATVSTQDLVTDQIELYPIPTQDYLFVKGLNSKEFYIFSMEGKMMKESFQTTLVDEDTRIIDVSGLTSGLYYFKTTQGVIKFFKI